MTGDGAIQLTVRVNDAGADTEELDNLTTNLRREFLDLDFGAVEVPRSGRPPAGAKGGDLAAVGELLMSVASPDLLTAVVSAAGGWLAGRHQRTVTLEVDGDRLDVTGVSSRQQQRLIDDWLRRRADR